MTNGGVEGVPVLTQGHGSYCEQGRLGPSHRAWHP